ncbi:MAG: hypothetical protein ACKO0Z_14240 [Betaproteobacteria bacterium]
MADLSMLSSIVSDAYRHGGQFFLTRASGEFFLTSHEAMPDELLLRVEQCKLSVYAAIGGSGDSDSGGNGGGTPSDVSGLTAVLKGLAEILAQRGLEVLTSDEITQESLNRHYYHFSTKFDAIAAAFEGLA